jgi:hypothetical protein
MRLTVCIPRQYSMQPNILPESVIVMNCACVANVRKFTSRHVIVQESTCAQIHVSTCFLIRTGTKLHSCIYLGIHTSKVGVVPTLWWRSEPTRSVSAVAHL